MKEFVVSELQKFLGISDIIETPFKFLQIDETRNNDTVYYEVKASVWMRTAFLTYETTCSGELYEQTKHELLDHDFVLATIREAPITLK